jgi:hypothetical protein
VDKDAVGWNLLMNLRKDSWPQDKPWWTKALLAGTCDEPSQGFLMNAYDAD